MQVIFYGEILNLGIITSKIIITLLAIVYLVSFDSYIAEL